MPIKSTVTDVGKDQTLLINGVAFNFAVLPWGDNCFGKAAFGVKKLRFSLPKPHI
jgi:hypothetical protein